MGTASFQGNIWGARAADWAELGEPVSRPAFESVFTKAGVGSGTDLLDLGCGAGTALVYGRELGATVAGLDAAAPLIDIARSRLPGARLEVGDLERLPFPSEHYDLVTGFNSFQFAEDIPAALREAARVCKPGGSVAMCVWGSREECESVAHTISAVMALVPPPPPPKTPRPPLFTPGVMEGLFAEAALKPRDRGAVDCPFVFPDAETAWRCFASAGNTQLAFRQIGEEPVRRAVLESLKPFTLEDGSVAQKNRFHWLMGTKPRT